MDMMKQRILILVILFISFIVQGTESSKCSTEQDCRCIHVGRGKYKADCSSKSLNFVPKFYSNVVAVDLSNNYITKFPTDGVFPKSLITLNFSKNKLSEFEKSSFTNLNFLKYLDLSFNDLCLNNETFFLGLFKNLKSLVTLNLKKNCMASAAPRQYYPDDVFKDLKMLRNLSIDGFPNTKFGVGFSELKYLTHLDLSGISGVCDLSYMSADFFKFLPHLERVDISDCQIMRIENGTFRNLKNLTNLDISFNEDLTFRVLSNVSYDLQSTKILVLRGNKIHRTFGIGTEVFVKDLEYLQNTKLKELYLDSNRMEIIESGVFDRLPKSLIYASLADNKFTMGRYIFEVLAVSNIKVLNASFQHVSHNPSGLFPPPSKDSCDQQVRNLCPGYSPSSNLNLKRRSNQNVLPLLTTSETNRQINDKYSFFFEKNVSGPIIAPFPPNLERLYFQKCSLRYSLPAINFLTNKIKYADMSGNILSEWIGPVKYLNKLQHMDLSNNYCSNVSTFFFCCVEQLETLLIADNYLGFVLNKDIGGLTFSRLISLKRLDISLNRIQELQPNIFRGLASLKYLNISNNALRQWTFEIKHMTKLKYIDFSNNELTDLAKNIRNDLDEMTRKQNVTLNLRNNNFLCNCDTLDFVKWMATTKIKFQFFETYRCQNTEINTVKFKHLPDIIRNLNWKCKYNWMIIIGSSILGSIVVVISCLVIIYRLRWVIRTWYYLLVIKRNRNPAGYTKLDENEADEIYKYDVFFIYDDEDRRFVWKAVQKLRSRNLRVCFREYDFIIGSSDYKSICFALKGSRKIVIVVSENLVDSKICDFQIDLAHTESEYRDSGLEMLLVLNYRDIPLEKTPLEILNLRRRNLYIDFPKNDEENEYFWQLLYDKIQS